VVLPPVVPVAAPSPGMAAYSAPTPATAIAAAVATPVTPAGAVAAATPLAAATAMATPAAAVAAMPLAPPAVMASVPALPAAAPVTASGAPAQAFSVGGAAVSAAAPAAMPSPPRLAALRPPRGEAPPMAPTWVSTPGATTTPVPASAAPAGGPGAAANDRPTPGMIALRNTADPTVVNNPYNWSVMVYKSQHRLVVYFRGHLYKEYHAVFGRNLDPGTKLWSGDRRTPEGAYTIIAKRLNARWRYFLKLNYPNNADRARYEQLVADGEVPRYRGRAISPGDGIGIHGTDEPILNTGNVNWTTGCISVDNGAIEELEALLPVGTLVVIKH